MIDKAIKRVSISWQKYLWNGAILAGASSLLFFRLYKLVPLASNNEVAAREAARTIDLLIQNPLFLPHKLLQFGLFSAGFEGLLASRTISVFFGIIALLFFYRVVRTWFTPRVAFLSSVLFVSSSWFLHYTRNATPLILYTLSIALLWCGLRLRSNKPRNSTILISSLIIISSLFVPGLIWFILAGFIWQRKRIIKELKGVHPLIISFVAVSSLAVAGILGWAFYKDSGLLLAWLGLPEVFDAKESLLALALAPYHIFMRAPLQPEMWLGRLPYLSITATILFGLGMFVLYRSAALDRIRAMLGMMTLGVVLASLRGDVSMIIIMPIIFVSVAVGVALLLQQWFTVFPRNPIARTIGLIFVSGLIFFNAFYNIYKYYVVWPLNKDTQNSYTHQIE